jgi:hypothetical protein
VIACIALFVAMGGSAYAVATGSINGREVKNFSLTGKDIKKNGVGGVTITESRLGTVPSAESLSHSAVVTAAGQFVRGKGVTSAVSVAEGRYQVTFNRNIQGCVTVASVGDPSAATPPAGQATPTGLATNGNTVQIRTTQATDGTPANRGFNLIVSC